MKNPWPSGVSDAFASALWVIDFMLQAAQGGISGVNLHGGGLDGVYSPIVGDPDVGYTARPITKGMKFANEFAGETFVTSRFRANGANAAAYVARKGNELLIGIVNRGARMVNCTLGGELAVYPKEAMALTVSSPGSKTSIEFRNIALNGKRILLPPYVALLIRCMS